MDFSLADKTLLKLLSFVMSIWISSKPRFNSIQMQTIRYFLGSKKFQKIQFELETRNLQ